MKGLIVSAFGLLASAAWAQTPDVAIKADIRLHYTQSTGAKTKVRWYDPMGRPSTVGIGMNLEPGYYLLITERLARIGNDIDREQIDEAYLEDPGSWRIGRQYLPFGARNLIREAALGARLDFPLILKNLPTRTVIFDNGESRLRGAMIRIGNEIGLSVGYGQHLGAASTSFGQIRDPQQAAGVGRGYRLAIAMDATRTWGIVTVGLEALALRRPNQAGDRSEDFSDLTLRWDSSELRTTFGWTRAWKTRDDFFRAESELSITRNVMLTGFVRFQRGSWRDMSVGLRVKM